MFTLDASFNEAFLMRFDNPIHRDNADRVLFLTQYYFLKHLTGYNICL